MAFINKISSKKHKFTRLLVDLTLIFFLIPTASSTLGYFLIIAGFFYTNILLIDTLSLNKKWIYGFRLVAILAFIGELMRFSGSIFLTELTNIMASLSYSAFIVLAIIAIGNTIFAQTKVNIDIINGGICIFLLLGFLWFNIYRTIILIDSNAFQGLSSSSSSYSDIMYQMLYYSFTTITTLGYGDITPVNKLAMTFANAEAIFGLMYPSIFIARLVGLYSTQDDENKNN